MDGFERRRARKELQILEASEKLFMQYGVKKTSIAEIAKEANVSQVTIYNYFENKTNLVHQVFLHYISKATEDFVQLVNSSIAFPEKIKHLIFNEKALTQNMNPDFYAHLMQEYRTDVDFANRYNEEYVNPLLRKLFDEGKETGYIDPNINPDALLFYVQMLISYAQNLQGIENMLPLAEDIVKLFFYGLFGERDTENK
ncbi:TetR/AcrR family transcriptional regulator [Listeria costaricensis]|uniref:TetR/AcrR family transcriptional regulator n=1 Tax=Listeria costaricensis TaxID=2026604 RepID=UPI000C074C1A|nr:TetR/AcrR family transcriptional regulator [Listeria costaricensis]